MPTRDVVLCTGRVHRQQGLQRRRRSGSTSSSCSTPEKRRASPNLRQSHFSWPPAGTSTWPLTRETPWCQVGLDMCVLVALQRSTSRTTRTTSTAGNAARARRSSDQFFVARRWCRRSNRRPRPDGSDSPAQMLSPSPFGARRTDSTRSLWLDRGCSARCCTNEGRHRVADCTP